MDCTAANHPFFRNRISSNKKPTMVTAGWAAMFGIVPKSKETDKQLRCRLLASLNSPYQGGTSHGLFNN